MDFIIFTPNPKTGKTYETGAQPGIFPDILRIPHCQLTVPGSRILQI